MPEFRALRFLCIFAIPRTGSSHLDKVFRSCRELNSKSEMFHGHAGMRVTPQERTRIEALGCDVIDEKRKFALWRRQHAVELLDALYRAHNRPIVFKVFPSHLKTSMLEEEFLSRSDMAFAVLRRRPIECFISGIKAREASKFTKVDTTAIKPELEIGDFLHWARKMRHWYRWAYGALKARDQPFARLSFEEHLDGLSGEEALARIVPLLTPLGFPQVRIPRRVFEGQRQDKEPRFRERPANWDAFEEAARAHPEAAEYLEWAMRAP
jgi:hypothetical protein